MCIEEGGYCDWWTPGQSGGGCCVYNARWNRFGQSVAIDGDLIAVGAHEDREVAYGNGAVYLFVRSGTKWIQQEKLIPNHGSAEIKLKNFGYSVCFSNATLIAGAIGDTTVDKGGKAYIFS